MADSSNSDSGDDTSAGSDREAGAGTPRWVKVFGIIGLVIVLLFVIMMLGGGRHGPHRHTPSVDTAGQTRPAARQ
jgi:hypothetical protein